MAFMRQRVHLKDEGTGGAVGVGFELPSADEVVHAGLNADGWKQIRQAPWWDEMVADIIETPEMCDPDDAPERVLEYAQDVVSEYIRKRAKLE